jgi:hypothetical protein
VNPIITLLVTLTFIALLSGCTIAPTHVESHDIGFIGNAATSSGIIVDGVGQNFKGFIVPSELRDEYNSLIDSYGGPIQSIDGELIGFTPPLKHDAGCVALLDGRYEMDAAHMHQFKKMAFWRNNNVKPQSVIRSYLP